MELCSSWWQSNIADSRRVKASHFHQILFEDLKCVLVSTRPLEEGILRGRLSCKTSKIAHGSQMAVLAGERPVLHGAEATWLGLQQTKYYEDESWLLGRIVWRLWEPRGNSG